MRFLKISAITVLLLAALGAAFLYKGDLPKEAVDAKYSNLASRFLEMENGSRVHFRDEGNPRGPAIVLLHGSNASLHTFEPWIEILGQDYRIITLDLPGHGLTGRVPDDDYGMDAFIRTIDAVTDEVGVPNFVLGGNSMGGGVTWQYTLRHPERVSAMILIDSSGLPAWRNDTRNETPGREPPLAFKLLSQDWFRAIARYLDPHALVEQGLKSSYNNSPVVNDELIERYYELSIREGTRDATLARFGSFARGRGGDFDLSQITVPTLIMWGAQDALIPVSTAEKFAGALSNATTVIYDDLGHIPMEEDPARSAADVLAFLSTLNWPQMKKETAQ